MLAHWKIAVGLLIEYAHTTYASLHSEHVQQPLAARERVSSIRLPLHNIEDWLFTTSVGIGTPPQDFTVALDIAWSDLFVPSVGCPDKQSSSCWPHPLFNSSASSSFRSTNRRSKVNRAGFYTSGDVAEDTLHLGFTSVPGQVFEQADDFRPTYVFNDSWYDAVLGFSRRTVRIDDSDLQAKSPFQNLVMQNILRHNRFSLQLPQTPTETGELLIGGVNDAAIGNHHSSVELPLHVPESPQSEPFGYVSHHSQTHIQRIQFTSGGWEVQPISVTFGNLTFDLSTFTAAFSTAQYWLDLPYAFAAPMKEQLGVSIWDGSIDCDARSAGFPDLVFAFRGFHGTVVEFSITPDEYIRRTPIQLIIDPSNKCQVPIATHRDRDDYGYKIPKFIILGNTFLRKFRSVFDADRRTIVLNSI